MKKTLVLAALLAATAFTPAYAQDVATAAEPTPIPERVMVDMAQREADQRERGPRGGGEVRPAGGGQDRPDSGERRQRQDAPVQQATPVQSPIAGEPAERRWNRAGENDGQYRDQRRDDRRARRQENGRIDSNPGGAVVVQAQPDRNWGRQMRNDTQRRDGQSGDGRSDNRRRTDEWQRNRDNGGQWNADRRNDGRWDENGRDGRNRRNDGWRNDGWRNDTWRNDTWRNDGQWGGNGRNDGWRNDTWRNDGRRFDRGFDQRAQWQNQYRNWNGRWNRDWRRDQRFDWQRYRFANRRLFQGGRYFAPNGWDFGYRRFSIGFGLSPLLFGQRYWINDPFNFRLPPVAGPFRWVRYYDDVLLVDLRSGQVVDAIYDFFW